ncbi:type VI secretion system protein ImpG [Oxalobacteraceae bacterium GrIS 1.11]
MNELLPHYERELGLLRRYSREFAERHPKIAGNLLMAGEVCEDPRIERLIQSCALLNARTSKRLDDDYPEFTEALFEVLYPHYLRPFPSCSIVRFDYGAAVSKLAIANTIKRGTELKTLPVKGVKCQFKNAYDVTVAPVALSEARFDAILAAPAALTLPPTATSKISLSITTTVDQVRLAQLGLASLRVFIDGEPAFCAGLKDTLLIHTVRAYVEFSGNGQWITLDKAPIGAVGFAESEALIPFPARAHAAYRLLTEYFSYPEKFNFFDIDLQAINRLMPEACQGFTLHLTLGGLRSVGGLRSHPTVAQLLDTLSAKNMLLGCTPVINAFKQQGKPVTLTHAMEHYPMVANSRSAFAYEVLAIDSLQLVCDSPQGNPSITEVRPLYSLRHGALIDQSAHYWAKRRDDAVTLKRPGHETEISLVDIDGNRSLIESGTLNIALTCSNRDLPSRLSYGLPGGDLSMKGGVIKYPIRFLHKPTAPHRFKRGQGAHWRLISNLSLNHLMRERGGLKAFKEMLTLYNLPGSAISQHQIDGIAAIEQKMVNAWMPGEVPPYLARGIEVRMIIDDDDFSGTGIHGFAQLMEHFFALYVNTNSFTQLVIVSKRSGEELLRCLPRSGILSLL